MRNLPAPLQSATASRARERLSASACLLAVSLCGPGLVLAQVRPDAGLLLEGTRPQAPLQPLLIVPPPDGALGLAGEAADERAPAEPVPVRVTAVRFAGNQVYSDAELQAVLAPALADAVDFAGLQALAQRVTAHYRAQGYRLARAYLPPQEMADGLLTIQVLEGRLEQVTLRNESGLSDARLRASLGLDTDGAQGLQSPALRQDVLERRLLLTEDLAGIALQSLLRPGATQGGSVLDIEVREGRAVGGLLVADNDGSRYTGAQRLDAALTFNNPLGLGDALALRLTSSFIGYDYARLSWQLPVGSDGWRGGLAWSDMRYRLGEEFAALRASGQASAATLYAQYPVVRSRRHNLWLELSTEQRWLDDRIEASASAAQKRIEVASVGLAGDFHDDVGGGAHSRWHLRLAGGHLARDAASAASDAAGYRAVGDYSKLSGQLERVQSLDGSARWSLFGKLAWQAAGGKNLDSSEKFALGGASAVRAYPVGERPSDDAVLASVELRYNPAPAWQLFALYDAAQGQAAHQPLPTDAGNQRSLSGWGLGLFYQRAAFMGRVTLAWRGEPAPAAAEPDRTPRLWLQLGYTF